MRLKNNTPYFAAIILFVVLNSIASMFYGRIDFTKDKRYTLSKAAITSVKKIKSPVIIDVLLAGAIPAEFRKIQEETKQTLEAFSAINPEIKVNFVNPLQDSKNTDKTIAELQQLGLAPTRVTTKTQDAKIAEELVFAWALVHYKNKTEKVALLKNKLGADMQWKVTNSIAQLEYVFADAFTKISTLNKKKVAVLKGNGNTNDRDITDFLTSLKSYYNIGAFTLDSVANSPVKTLEALQEYDAALLAGPTKEFTDAEKFTLDQYIMHGGKMVFLIDPVTVSTDSLFNNHASTLAFGKKLGLEDMLFKYGVRYNSNLINDAYATPIVLAQGNGRNTQYNPIPWGYHPMVFSKNNHPININIEAVKLQFTSSLDTLKNDIKKTIVLQSSALSTSMATPKKIHLQEQSILDKKIYQNTKSNHALAVVLEGKFKSAFTNRILPFTYKNTKTKAPENKMLVVTDADIIKNQWQKGRPLELGYDKWTNTFYGNKAFLLNSFNYLLEDTALLSLRSKRIAICTLDKQKTTTTRKKWQLINTVLPLLVLAVLAIIFSYWRKHKYAKKNS